MEFKVALCDDDEKIASKIMEAFNNELQCVCSISSDTRIVFITSHEELVFDTFEYTPFYFIRKKYYEAGIKKLINKLAQYNFVRIHVSAKYRYIN